MEHFPHEVSWCPTGVYKEGGAPSLLVLRPLLSGELAPGRPQAKGGKTTVSFEARRPGCSWEDFGKRGLCSKDGKVVSGG